MEKDLRSMIVGAEAYALPVEESAYDIVDGFNSLILTEESELQSKLTRYGVNNDKKMLHADSDGRLNLHFVIFEFQRGALMAEGETENPKLRKVLGLFGSITSFGTAFQNTRLTNGSSVAAYESCNRTFQRRCAPA